MKRLDAPLAIAMGTALVLVANAALLGAAWWNRSGPVASRLELTERELAMPLSRANDDTGLVLTIALTDRPPAAVRRAAANRDEPLPPVVFTWFDTGKLAALGFDVPAIERVARVRHADGYIFGIASRRAFVALEYDGEAWRSWLAAREAESAGATGSAAALVAIDRTSRSRLMPVDAAPDSTSLRAKYPDSSRVAIVAAYVGVRATSGDDGAPTLHGAIERLEVESVSVPRALLAILEPFVPLSAANDADRRAADRAGGKRWPEPAAPRYRATLVHGRGLWPWIEGAAPAAE